MTYFHRREPTIIGAGAFHRPVRDGKGWFHSAMVVRQRGGDRDCFLFKAANLDPAFGLSGELSLVTPLCVYATACLEEGWVEVVSATHRAALPRHCFSKL